MSLNNKNMDKLQLTGEELGMLLNKLSSDEREELSKMLKSCTSEVTATRGLPITAAVLGSLYFARTRLPPQYHFGPKGWPFYAILGIGTLTAVNVLSMGMCRDRVQPFIAKMWQKYNVGQSTTTYEDIRRRNRQQYGFQSTEPTTPTSLQPGFNYSSVPVDRPATDPYGLGTATVPSLGGGLASDIGKYEQTFDLTSESGFSDSQRRSIPVPYSSMYSTDTPTYMSGTPTANRMPQPSSDFTR